MPIIVEIVMQHGEQAAMLWLTRRGLSAAPHLTLAELAKFDGRVEAHLDGLRIAGHEGWKICEEQLALNEAGEAFTAAVLAFESGDRSRIEKVLHVGTSDLALTEALVSALGWLPASQAQTYARSLLSMEAANLRRVGLACCAIHRQNPGDALRFALKDKDPSLQAWGAKAAGELGRLDLTQDLNLPLTSENLEVRFWSAWSLSLLTGSSNALSMLPSAAGSSASKQAQAVQMSMRRLSQTDAKALQKKLAQRPEQRRLALIAAGALGDPENIPWLVEQTKFLPLARLAGEAFTMITGVDLAYRDLERKPPEDFNAGPTDDPKDENVEMDPDDNLPWPEPALVQKWWDKNRGQFQTGTRYLLGKPMTADWLKTVLRDGRQRQRAAAALELSIRQPGTPLFNVKAPGFRQIELLGKPGEPIR